MAELRGLISDDYQIADTVAHWSTCTLAIGLHRVSIHTRTAGRLPQGKHTPFNE